MANIEQNYDYTDDNIRTLEGVEHIRRRFHEMEHEIRAGEKEHGEQDAEKEGGSHGGFHRPMEQPVILCPEAFADDHRGTDGKSVEKENRHVGDHGGGTDGSQGLGPHEIPHHNGIHRIVQHLENIADHQWQGKFQDQPGNVAGSHVFGCGTGHGTACLSLFGMDNFYYNIEKGVVACVRFSHMQQLSFFLQF